MAGKKSLFVLIAIKDFIVINSFYHSYFVYKILC